MRTMILGTIFYIKDVDIMGTIAYVIGNWIGTLSHPPKRPDQLARVGHPEAKGRRPGVGRSFCVSCVGSSARALANKSMKTAATKDMFGHPQAVSAS